MLRSGTILQFPLSRGLAEDTNAKTKPVATLKSGVNVRWAREGTLAKRYGSVSQAPESALPGVQRFVARGGELSAVVDGSLWSYQASTDTWLQTCDVSDVSLTWSTSVDGMRGVKSCDVVVLSNGYIVEAWVTGDPIDYNDGYLYYQVRDLATGVVITPPTEVTQSGLPRIRLVASGNTWVLLYLESGSLKWVTSTGSGTLKTGAHTTASLATLDACVIGTDFVVAFTLLAGGIRLVRASIAATPVEAATDVVTGETSTAIWALSICGTSGEDIYIAYHEEGASDLYYACADPSTLAQTLAKTFITSATDITRACLGLIRYDAHNAVLVCSIVPTNIDAGALRTYLLEDDGTVTAGQQAMFLHLLSKPFAVGSHVYAFASTDPLALGSFGSNSDSFLLDVTYQSSTEPFGVVGKVDVFAAGSYCRGFVAAPAVVSATKQYVPLPFQSTPTRDTSGWRQGTRLVRVGSGTDLSPDAYRNVEFDGEAKIAAGLLTAYDGVEALGYGWPFGPLIDSNNLTAATSGSMANGTYIYNVTAERRSSVGVLHRSPIGIPTSVAVTGPNGSVGVGIVTPSIGRSTLLAGLFPIYRSEANGSVLYRETVEPEFMDLYDSSFGSTYPVTVSDTSPDTAIGNPSATQVDLNTRPQMYTESGELEDCSPPSPYSLHFHGGRLGIITGNRREYWYSKDIRDNPGIAPGFHPSMSELYDQELVSCATLDAYRIMFSASSIWFVGGAGPNVTGLDNTFSPPARVQSDVGCTNARSVVTWPGGVLFQNDSDLFNLSRGLVVEWIGKDARDTLEAYPLITSAVLVSSESEIRFTCNASDDSAGIVLVFDYERKTWTTRTYLDGVPIRDAILHGGRYYMATDDVVLYEDTSTFLDDGAYVESTVELNHIVPSGIGWQRVRIAKMLGRSLSNHALTISAARDFATTYEQSASFVAGDDVLTPTVHSRAEVALTVQRRQSIALKLVDSSPANTTTHPLGNGAGFELEGVALLIQPLGGLPRDTPSRRGG